MTKKMKKAAAFVTVLAILVLTTSSCNRGVGCPNNFSLDTGVITNVLGK